MKNDNQNKSIQTSTQKTVPTPHEIKPKLEFGTIEIAAIFGIILTAIVGIIVKIWWAKRERIIKASDDLHATFAPALAQIYLAKKRSNYDVAPAPNVEKYLIDSLIEQATVIEKFRIFVPDKKKVAYQKAWENYRSDVTFGFNTNSFRDDIDVYELYEELIHDILAFSRHRTKSIK
jgi:hypothetical protein